MLREIGVDASLVLARTRRGGDLDAEPASLAPFDHAIVYVPQLRPVPRRHRRVLRRRRAAGAGPGHPGARSCNEGKLERTPVLTAAHNRVATERARHARRRAARRSVDEHVTVAGEVAHEWRAHYQSPAERPERYGKAWAQKHPGRARRVGGDAAARRSASGRSRCTRRSTCPIGRAPEARRAGDAGARARGRHAALVRAAVVAQARSGARLSRGGRRIDVTVALPPGCAVKRLPEARDGRDAVRPLHADGAQKGGAVEVVAALEVDRHRITREDYAAFRRFCADVDAADRAGAGGRQMRAARGCARGDAARAAARRCMRARRRRRGDGETRLAGVARRRRDGAEAAFAAAKDDDARALYGPGAHGARARRLGPRVGSVVGRARGRHASRGRSVVERVRRRGGAQARAARRRGAGRARAGRAAGGARRRASCRPRRGSACWPCARTTRAAWGTRPRRAASIARAAVPIAGSSPAPTARLPRLDLATAFAARRRRRSRAAARGRACAAAR